MKSVSKLNRNLGLPALFVACLFFLTLFGIRLYLKHQNTPQAISENFQREYIETEETAKQAIEFFISHFDTSSSGFLSPAEAKESIPGNDDMYLFVHCRDSIVYWSSNKVILPEGFTGQSKEKQGVAKLQNGWYGFQNKRAGSYLFTIIYLIKQEFPFQNDYISNGYAARFSIPGSVSLELSKGKYPVFSKAGSYQFSLNFSRHTDIPIVPPLLMFFLFIAGSLFLLYFLYRLYEVMDWFDSRKNLMVLFFCMDIIILRAVQYWYGFPAELTSSELFSPALYSSTVLLPSLGDFTINSILFFIMCLAAYLNCKLYPRAVQFMKERPLPVASFAILITLTAFQFVGYLITDLVNNSSLSLNLQNISGLTFESGYGLFIISLILVSYLFIATKVFHALFSLNLKPGKLIFSSGIAGLLYCLIHWFIFGRVSFEISLFFFLYLAAYWYLHSKNQDHFSVQHLLFVMCFYAVFATFLLNQANDRKETEKRNLLAVKLATKRNPVTEVLYEQLERKLIADSLVRSFFEPSKQTGMSSQDQLVDYLRVQYFKDYWQKYSVQITLCDSAKELRIQPQGYLVNCNTYFRGTINSFGEATLMPNLHFLDYGFGKEYYLAILTESQFNFNTPAKKSIVIELNLINAYPDPGYPGLLMDKTRIDLPNLSDYSYGLFQNGRLVHSVGSYNYRMELGQYHNYEASATAFTDDRMIHYQYPVNKSNSLLISMKERSFLTLITPFSYLFILFAAIALTGAGIINFRNNRHILPKSLRNRLHLSLLGILVLTLLVIGIVQVINIININSKKNLANLREKAYSIQIEVQHRYGNMPDIQDETKKELGYFLIKLSNVFFTDINFYNETGILIASSRPQIFEEGLVSKQMNPDAFTALVVEGGSAFIHNESIGTMHFSSAYLPLYNEQGSLLGYINLPYFSRQDELKREISTFLVTFLNIYILLLLFGVFVTILISNYITAPLSMLAGKMSRLRLGIVNEKITWYHDDEIGQLVSEYNRMIDELARSAEMLARSERESAWREMARQVAHEIKNPLTPMKLSAQHLQKAWSENAPDMGERLNRFTRTLIEQIDTLSAIASDFSSFAKMPVVVNERINLEELINFVLSMYKDTSAITYDFQSAIQDPHLVADRALLIRIFTNLLNNAVQAIGEKQGGRVDLRLFIEKEVFVVTVTDNGSGISSERAAKIFQPDFTTKTGGMGLGLAIVKGIITSMKGEISFTSEEEIGTTFIIKIPTDVTHE